MVRCSVISCLPLLLLLTGLSQTAIALESRQPDAAAVVASAGKTGTDAPPSSLSSEDEPVLLPVVTVIGEQIREPGELTRTGEDLKNLPHGNGTLNELLRNLPGIQLSDQARLSTQGGEILPPEISISGGRFFQNQYLVDGVSINNNLDPLATTPSNFRDVPGHSQGLFIAPALVGSVTVYEHSVPARFGGFTGGVVEVESRDPGPQFGGRLIYRTTRDSWTSFHVPADQKDAFEDSSSEKKQPRFDNHQGGVELNLPLGPRSALLASYQLTETTIPLHFFSGTKDQSRRLENFFLKYLLQLPSANTIKVSYLGTPYRGEYFFGTGVDSEYTLRGGGEQVNIDFNHVGSKGDFHIEAAYHASENSRRSSDVWYYWKSTPSRNWGTGTSIEGGSGDLDKNQKSYQFKFDFTSLPIRSGSSWHNLDIGFDLKTIEGSFDRPKSLSVYTMPKVSDVVVCPPGDDACIDAEQYLSKLAFYPVDRLKAHLNQGAFYLEDRIELGRLTLRPGLRYSYDDYQGNANLAPRLSGRFDLFGNARTIVFAGLNRYYGQVLITDKLSEAKEPPLVSVRSLDPISNEPTSWVPSSTPTTRTLYKRSNLKTPYVDEYVIGFDQSLLGGRLVLEGIHREGRDELAADYEEVEPLLIYMFFNNEGRSRHRSIKMNWERAWSRFFVNANLAWQETFTNAVDYSEVISDTLSSELVWYRGETFKREELPREDFNRSWVGNLTLVWQLPYGFTFSNLTQYRSGYEALLDTGKNHELESGEKLDIFAKVNNPESWFFDWKLEWRRNLTARQQIALTMELLNVFNEKVQAGDDDDKYEAGRQFWAGAEYSF